MVLTRFDYPNSRPTGYFRISCGDGPRKPLTRARVANDVCIGAEYRSSRRISRGVAPPHLQMLYWTPSRAQGRMVISGGECGQRPSCSISSKWYVRVEPPAPLNPFLVFHSQNRPIALYIPGSRMLIIDPSLAPWLMRATQPTRPRSHACPSDDWTGRLLVLNPEINVSPLPTGFTSRTPRRNLTSNVIHLSRWYKRGGVANIVPPAYLHPWPSLPRATPYIPPRVFSLSSVDPLLPSLHLLNAIFIEVKMDFGYSNTSDFSAFDGITFGQDGVSVIRYLMASIETYHSHLFYSSQRLNLMRKT